jgi:hypothetical protein
LNTLYSDAVQSFLITQLFLQRNLLHDNETRPSTYVGLFQSYP